MKYTSIFYFLFLVAFISCSEGELIEDDVDFEAALNHCSNGDDFVFFKINPNADQTISLRFSSTTFDISPLAVPTDTFTVALNTTTNQLNYREFNTSVTEDYFCSSIPTSTITTTYELVGSDGTIEIDYVLKDDQDPNAVVYTRTVVIKDLTLIGNGISLRREVYELGSEDVIFTN